MHLLLLCLFYLHQASPTPAPAAGPDDPLKFWVQVGSLVGALIGLLTFLTKGVPRIKGKLDRRSLQIRMGAEAYTKESLENSLKNFVPPMCQDVDPAGGDEPRNVYGVKQPLFNALDDALGHPEIDKFFILLADSGMGKTTALLNYYLRHIRRWRKPRYELALVPLTIEDADKRIAAIPNQEGTVLFLDALDEDTLAIVDYVERLRLLLKATSNFRSVLISCRTQFFSKDEEIPKETGRIRISDRRAGQEAEYYFQKIYLSPFSDDQVRVYLRRKYPFWKKERALAFDVAKKIPHLTARPMLLAHIDDLLKSKRHFRYSFELYEEMVSAWLRREQGYVKEQSDLLEFSKKLAVDLYLNRAARRAEKIPKDELVPLARKWNIQLDEWKLSGRSLLNRDAEGNYKFAHRSVMEYLFARQFLDGDYSTLSTQWTDQMLVFLFEHMIDMLGELRENRSQVRVLGAFQDRQALNHVIDSVKLGVGRGVRVHPLQVGAFIVRVLAATLNSVCREDVSVLFYLVKGTKVQEGRPAIVLTRGQDNPVGFYVEMVTQFMVGSDARLNLKYSRERKILRADLIRTVSEGRRLESRVYPEVIEVSLAYSSLRYHSSGRAFFVPESDSGALIEILTPESIPDEIVADLLELYVSFVATSSPS